MGALREVVTIAMGTGVLPVGEVGDGKEVFREDHAAGDACTKFLDLVAYVMKECVTRPVPDEHDGVDWHSGKIHGHGGG